MSGSRFLDWRDTMLSGALKLRGKRQTKKTFALGETDPQLRLLGEIARDIEEACPKYMEMTRVIRQFAATHLSDRRNVVLGVTSATKGVGCTTVALSLASALADISGNVIYVESERSAEETLQEQADYVSSSGLYGYLRGDNSLEDSILYTGHRGLSILPAGQETDGVAPLERLGGIRALVSTLRDSYNITIIDLPPLLTSEDSPALVSGLDGVLLVVAAGKTDLSDVKKSIGLCGSVPVEGVIMNHAVRKTPGWLASLFTPEGQRGLA